jgi:biopolymer transport protein ExbB
MKPTTLRLLPLFLAGFVMLTAGLYAQAPATPAPAPADSNKEEPAVHTKTLWEQIREGGWVMIPIGVCSVMTLYLIGDGLIRTGAKSIQPKKHVDMIKSAFRQGDYVAAYDYCKANSSPFTNVCGVAVSLLGEGKEAVEEGVVGELAKENSQLSTYISYLSVIGVCTPMIGLLGTVTGMIKAFATLGSSGIGDPSAHRHPGVHRLLHPAQPRHQGHSQHPGHHGEPPPQDALRATRRREYRR